MAGYLKMMFCLSCGIVRITCRKYMKMLSFSHKVVLVKVTAVLADVNARKNIKAVKQTVNVLTVRIHTKMVELANTTAQLLMTI